MCSRDRRERMRFRSRILHAIQVSIADLHPMLCLIADERALNAAVRERVSRRIGVSHSGNEISTLWR